MIMVDFIDRAFSVATQPTVCMHCESPLAPCAQVCPVLAILITPEGVVQQADASRCIACRNCALFALFSTNRSPELQQCKVLSNRHIPRSYDLLPPPDTVFAVSLKSIPSHEATHGLGDWRLPFWSAMSAARPDHAALPSDFSTYINFGTTRMNSMGAIPHRMY